MKRFIRLMCNMNLAPAGIADAGGTNDPAPAPTDPTPAPADPAPQPQEPALKDPDPADPTPWEVNVPEEYKQMTAPALEKYKTLGLTPKQAQALVDDGLAAVKDNEAKIDAEILEVKREWGAEFDTRQQAAVNAMAKLGFNEKEAAAMVGQVGMASVLKRFYEVSKRMSPGELKDGEALVDMAAMDADAANREIERLTQDAQFCDKLAAGDSAAKERWERLKAIRRGGK